MQKNNNEFTVTSVSGGETVYLLENFTDCGGTKEIHIGQKASVSCLVLIDGTTDINLSFVTQAPEATILVYALLLGNKGTSVKATIHAHLMHDKSSANVHLISFLPDSSTIHVDGGITIYPQVVQCSGHLLEENIILGTGIQIKTLPMLDVQSNDVSASHGARIEKLDAKKLFYAQSRGLSESEAKGLLIHGYFSQCFASFIEQESSLEELQQTAYERIMSR